MAASVKVAGATAGLCFLIFGSFLSTAVGDEFHEELLVKPLSDGNIYHHFQFTTLWNTTSFSEPITESLHFHLFPKPLGEVLMKFSVQELHLSMTRGLWRHEQWGYPVEDAPPGAELIVWFREDAPSIDETWTDLINVLSGMFCASLNFMDSKNMIIPKISFRPQGVVSDRYEKLMGNLGRYSALPNEIVCTENLTPWKKLLPCGSRAGLASLFNAVKLQDTRYHSLGIHFRPVCMDKACGSVGVELHQSLAVVFEMGPISSGKADWSFKKIYQRMLATSCPLATTSMIYVDIQGNKTEYSFTMDPQLTHARTFKRGNAPFQYAMYNIPDHVANGRVLNMGAKYSKPIEYGAHKKPMIHAQRFQTGFGQEKGGIMCLLYNNHKKKDLTVTYMEVIPWFLRVYYHTLKVETFKHGTTNVGVNGTTSRPLYIHYVPGKDRQRPYHMELVIYLPADSVTRLSFEFERALLKWTEYPPDANHGFYVNSAVISTVLPYGGQYTATPQSSSRIHATLTDDSTSFFVRLHTETLLVTLPTPDFSMPYNVICLACTVVAIAFGSFHNLTTRRFVIKDPAKQKGILKKLKEKIFGSKPVEPPKEKESEVEAEGKRDAGGEAVTSRERDAGGDADAGAADHGTPQDGKQSSESGDKEKKES